MKQKLYFLLLWIGCVIGSLAVLPFSQNVSVLTHSVFPSELSQLILVGLLEGAIVSGVLIYFGRKFANNVGLRFLLLENGTSVWSDIVKPGLIAGTLVTLGLLLIDSLLPNAPFTLRYLVVNTPPIYGLLGSVSGAFNQEVIFRLFIMAGIAYELTKRAKFLKVAVVGASIYVSALLFGALHIPQFVHSFDPETPLLLVRIILLNLVSGVTFGYLFWRRGFEVNMFAHWVTDVGLYVIVPLIAGIGK